MNRRGFLKTITASAAVLMADRALPTSLDGPQIILAKERGWWMGLYGRDRREIGYRGYSRAEVKFQNHGDQVIGRAYFGSELEGHICGYLLYRDGALIAEKFEQYGFKTRSQIWEISVGIHTDDLPGSRRIDPLLICRPMA